MVKNSAIFFAVFQEEFESTSQQTGWIGSIMASLSIAAGMKPKKKRGVQGKGPQRAIPRRLICYLKLKCC